MSTTEVHESVDLETHCDKNMIELQSFIKQEPRTEDKEFEEITSEEGKDGIISGLLRENFEQNLTRSDEDLADILFDLGKKNSVLRLDSHVSENFCQIKIFPSHVRKNTIICLFAV